MSLRDWQLERYLLGELPSDERRRIESALLDRPDLRARLEGLERSNAELLRARPAHTMAALVRAQAGPRRGPRLRARTWVAALGAAAMLFIVSRSLVPSGPGSGDDTTRLKGGPPQLLLFRQNAPGAVEQMRSGSTVRPGDVLQLAYHAQGRRYGVIVSIDGRGAITLHLPAAEPTAASLAAGGRTPLERAYRLDDAPGFERFYFVAADQPFGVETVVAAVRHRHAAAGPRDVEGRLALPEEWAQSTLAVRKEGVR